jgi:hypothetical protein
MSRSLVGVADIRHVSNVVCRVLPGDDATEIPRGTPAAGAVLVRVFAFFAGSCEGEGVTGELSKSSVSIVLSSGGVFGRSR